MGPHLPQLLAERNLQRLLRHKKDELVDLWRRRVLADPGVPEARRLCTPALIDHVPQLIEQLTTVLEGSDRAPDDPEGAARAVGTDAVSHAHAQDRFAAGYAMPSALRELSHVRAAIFDLCRREGLAIAAEEALLLDVDLDEVMVTAAERLHAAAQSELRASERQRLEILAREETARRAAERSDLELRRLSETGMLGIVVGTDDGRIVDANDAFLGLVGYSRDDLVTADLSWRDMTAPEHRHRDDLAIAEVAEQGIARPYEKVFIHRDGRPVDVLIGPASLDTASGTIVAFVLDIGARKTVEAALAEASRERDATLAMLETFMASAPAGFAVVDRDLRYLRINDTLARMNGRPAAEHIGRRIRDIIPQFAPQFADQAEAILRRVIDSGEPVTGVHVELPGDGRPRHLLASYYPLRSAEQTVTAIGGVVVDITAQKEAEQELRRDAELREQFMAVLGHDLRTPLMTILFAAQVLLRKLDLAPGYVRSIQRIKASARRMERLVNDLLDLVRSRHGGWISVAPQPLNLKDVCEQVIDEVNVTHAERAIEVVAHGGCQGRWDPDRMAQLASNLITNAVLYSPPDTPVRVEVGARDAHTVFLSVHNEGQPIPAELLPTIFDAFRRGGTPAVERSRTGLGLGLHIAQAIARAHGGRIEVDSARERGTTFTVVLPRDPMPVM